MQLRYHGRKCLFIFQLINYLFIHSFWSGYGIAYISFFIVCLFVCYCRYQTQVHIVKKASWLWNVTLSSFLPSFLPSPFFCYCSLRLFVLYSCLVWLKINPHNFLSSSLLFSFFLSLVYFSFYLFIYLFLFLFIVSLFSLLWLKRRFRMGSNHGPSG